MTLSLIYAFHLLLSKPLKRIHSPLFTVLVKRSLGYSASTVPIYKIHQ